MGQIKGTHITDKGNTHNENTWPSAAGNTTAKTDSPWASVSIFFPDSGGQSKGILLHVHILLIMLLHIYCVRFCPISTICERENRKITWTTNVIEDNESVLRPLSCTPENGCDGEFNIMCILPQFKNQPFKRKNK